MSEYTDQLYRRYKEARDLADDLRQNAQRNADLIFNQWLEACRLETTTRASLETATWEDLLLAINALSPAAVALRDRDFHDQARRFYVQCEISLHDRGMTTGLGNGGNTPELAVHDLWHQLTDGSPELLARKSAYSEDRVFARWENDHWVTWAYDVPEAPTEA